MKKKIRPLGDVLLDMEPLLFEIVEQHDIQRGDLLALISVWVETHFPGAIEQYEVDDSEAVWLYGHKDDVKRRASKL